MMEWNNDEISKLIDFIEKRSFMYVMSPACFVQICSWWSKWELARIRFSFFFYFWFWLHVDCHTQLFSPCYRKVSLSDFVGGPRDRETGVGWLDVGEMCEMAEFERISGRWETLTGGCQSSQPHGVAVTCLFLFCHAPLGVRSAKRRHQSPEWMTQPTLNPAQSISRVDDSEPHPLLHCRRVVGCHVLSDSLHPFHVQPPVLQVGKLLRSSWHLFCLAAYKST